MKIRIRSLVASILAFGLLTVGMQVSAGPDTQSEDPFLEEILQSYDS